ncbi:Hypothetical predicted protein [Paramuricea clavata]|uniref:Uncharacterized protein n=1 Tax=Paramuricea clavata TaxID=317549 RepID=A0A7D9EN07_PARCT|nr:Hypothetical predicted protein [Paramuricea clavata]
MTEKGRKSSNKNTKSKKKRKKRRPHSKDENLRESCAQTLKFEKRVKVKVLKFTRERSLPDCYTVIDNNFQMDVDGEVGYSDSAWPNGILEKQADMIRYLQQHNENLSRRLLRQTRATS